MRQRQGRGNNNEVRQDRGDVSKRRGEVAASRHRSLVMTTMLCYNAKGNVFLAQHLLRFLVLFDFLDVLMRKS